MQPCAVCGGVQVDAAGYCAQCRTFRGVPQQPPPQPSNYSPQPQPPYPGYPPPGSPAYPTSVPPGYPQQTSGGGYPVSYPAAPARPARSSFLVPLVALSATLAVLVMAIVVVVVARGGGDEPDPGLGAGATSGAGSSSASASPASDVDECVVGTWRVTSHKEEVPVEGHGKVTFTGGDGATLRLNADGTGIFDYKSGTEYLGELSGQTVRLEVSGQVTYSYTARNGSLAVTDVKSTASGRLYLDNEQYGDSEPLSAEDDTSTYTCSGDRLTQQTFLYTTEYERAS